MYHSILAKADQDISGAQQVCKDYYGFLDLTYDLILLRITLRRFDQRFLHITLIPFFVILARQQFVSSLSLQARIY